MNRKALLDTLELTKAGLADDALVPIFTNFCFRDSAVYAFKDRLGIMAPCEIAETFAVSGKTLIELLKTSSAKDVEFTLDDETCQIVAGKSRMKLPWLREDEFLFEEPEEEQWDVILDLDAHLLEGFQLCLVTTSSDNTMPAFMGISVVGGKTTHLYSCDGDALSRYRLDGKKTKEVHYTIPTDFCEAVLRIAEKTGYRAGQLYVNGEWAIAEFGNNYKVFGRIIENTDPMDYEKHIKKIIKGDVSFVTVPDGLASALNRARVIAEGEGKPTLLTAAKGKLVVNTETHVGVVRDTMKIDEAVGEVVSSVSAKLISRALAICDEFHMAENATVYRTGDDFLLLVANYFE